MMTHLDEQKLCCHHSLKDLQVHTDGAWWKLKQYSLHPGIGNYPQVCIVYLESFQIWTFQRRQTTFLHLDLLEVGKYIHTHFANEVTHPLTLVINVKFIPLFLSILSKHRQNKSEKCTITNLNWLNVWKDVGREIICKKY